MSKSSAACARSVKVRFGTALLVVALVSRSASGEDLSVEDFVAQVVQSNPTLGAAQARAMALGFRVAPARTLDDPFFAMGPDDVVMNGGGRMLRYQINQTLPLPAKLESRGRRAHAQASAAAQDAETTRRQLVVFATQAFFSAYFNQQAIELNTQTRDLLLPQIEASRSRYMTGRSGHHEWLLAKTQLGILETDRLRLRRDASALDAVLNELRSREPDSPVGALVARFEPNEALAAPASIAAQPEALALAELADVAQEEANLARLAYYPDLMVQGMVSDRDAMNERSTWGVMVGINLPIFSYRKQANLVRAAEQERSVALAEKRAIENRLRAELKEAEVAHRSAQDIVRLYESTVIPETKLALASVQEAYTAGMAPLTSLLNLAMIRLAQDLELLAARIDVELAQLRRRELLSQPPLKRFAPSAPMVFATESMGGAATMSGRAGMSGGGSAAGMGQGGMAGPAARPKDMGSEPSSRGMGNM